MKHSKKILALAMSIAVVASIAAAGTLAYLTGNGSVTNTFNVGTKGQVSITLDEAKVDETGKAIANADRVTENDYENMLPGQVLDKDPTVHVQANSAASYVFVEILNSMADASTLDINTDAWKAVDGRDGVYQYVGIKAENGVVPATDEIVSLEAVFNTVTIDKNLDAEGLRDLDGAGIIVIGYAIQAENLATETQTAVDVATSEAIAFFAQYDIAA